MKINPPGSATTPVIAPSWIVINAVPSGTIILLPLVIIFSLPLVFSPRPAFCPCATAGNKPAVGVTFAVGI